MTDVILAAILAVQLLGIVVGLLVLLKIRRTVRSFVEPLGEGQPSPLGTAIATTSDTFAKSIVSNAKTTFMGIQSGQARAEKAIGGELVQAQLASNPLLAGILKSFPALGKGIKSNPELVQGLLSKMAGSFGGQGQAPPGNGHNQGVKFKL